MGEGARAAGRGEPQRGTRVLKPPLPPPHTHTHRTDRHAITVTPCPDECYVDNMISTHVAAQLTSLAAAGEPFSFFAGFKRPHLGFQVPQKAWDAYSPAQPLAEDRWPPRGMPPQGWVANGEITGEADTRPFVLHNDTTFPGMLANGIHAPLRRAYYSAVSWVDTQIGLALDALDAAGLADSTWVTFIGDHGWALGEHGNWAKQSLFENALRVPLIIAPPRGAAGWRRGATVGAPHVVEALDLFPTIAELLGAPLPPPGQLEGRSLAPFLREGPPPPSNGTPSFAFSQIVREDRPGCKGPGPAAGFPLHGGDSDPPSPPHPAGGAVGQCLMGLSVRTAGYRYTAWLEYSDWGAASYGPVWGSVAGEELYDHTAADAAGGASDAGLSYDDASEAVNVAADPAYAQIKGELLAALKAGFPQRKEGRLL